MTATINLTPTALLESIDNQARRQVYEERDDQDFFLAHRVEDEQIRRRILIERAIIRRAAMDLLAAGFTLRIHDGEDWATERTTDLAIVMDALMSTDEDRLAVLAPDTRPEGERAPSGCVRRGTILLVYGNDGYDVIADNSTTMEEHLEKASTLADALCDAMHPA